MMTDGLVYLCLEKIYQNNYQSVNLYCKQRMLQEISLEYKPGATDASKFQLTNIIANTDINKLRNNSQQLLSYRVSYWSYLAVGYDESITV